MITLQNCYAPVFVDDIFTDGTQSRASKSESKRLFGLLVLVGRKVAPFAHSLILYMGLFSYAPRVLGTHSYSDHS